MRDPALHRSMLHILRKEKIVPKIAAKIAGVNLSLFGKTTTFFSFRGLADAAAASQQNACNDEVLTNQKKCKNIDFDFQYKADSNGQWCRSEMAYGGGGMNYDDYKKDAIN